MSSTYSWISNCKLLHLVFLEYYFATLANALPHGIVIEDRNTDNIVVSWDQLASSSRTNYRLWYWPDSYLDDIHVKYVVDHEIVLSDLIAGELYNFWLMGVQDGVTQVYVTFQHRTGTILSFIFNYCNPDYLND